VENEAAAKLGSILTPEQQKMLEEFRPPRRQGGQQEGPAGEGGRPEGRPRERSGGAGEDRPPSGGPEAQDRSASSVSVREPSSSLILRSPAMTNGGVLPKEFTGEGAGVTPPLEWTGAPAGTKSYVLIMHHTDARGENISYWVLYNIPPDVQGLPRDVKDIGTLGVNSRGHRAVYAAPHSAGPGVRTYVFTLYALSASPQFTVLPSEVSHEVLLAAMKDKILASADLSVSYTRYTVAASGDDRGADQIADRTGERAPRDSVPGERPRPDRPPGPGGGDGRRGPGGGGRLAENNKTPASLNPGQTMGIFLNTPKAFVGYTLLAPKHNTNIFLINNEGQIVHQWHSEYYPGQSVYLKTNGNLLHPCMTRNRKFHRWRRRRPDRGV
jgi:phosphatidylethanolamine-binding protein (PEBP) family uncharacterized protein